MMCGGKESNGLTSDKRRRLTRKENETTPVIIPRETRENYESR